MLKTRDNANMNRAELTVNDSDTLNSRIAGFYKMSLEERWSELVARGVLDEQDVHLLRDRKGGLPIERADKMVENVIGMLELPLGLGLNFVINGQDYVVPMAVEEPSIIAAVSHVAKIVRESGGFEAYCEDNTMIGQIQVIGCEDFEQAKKNVLAQKEELLAMANALHPNMISRGGGAKDLEVRILDEGKYRKMLVVHLYIDCCDAMGANLINTMAEGIAGRIESLTEGSVFLRILSNLADRRLVRARCRIPFEHLKWKSFSGREVAEGIELASQFAEMDPYRAATHNKGIMNGIGAVCVATGNDWRAIEAGAHAYVAKDGRYGAMAKWHIEDDAYLVGILEIPMQVGTVGGPIRLHPTVQLAHKVLGVTQATELACIMGAVGLAQNMAAIKALATIGIQKGHMSLHARSVAVTAGARTEEVDAVVAQLIASGEVKVHVAKNILTEMRRNQA